jgi:glycosyltransferase involved in cell wall biosynthesis
VTKKTEFNKKIISLPAGVDEDWINDNEKKFSKHINFCYLGSLDGNRGVKEIVRLAENLADKYENGKVIVMGDGDCRDYFLKYSAVHNNLKYYGNITDKRELQNILDSCHVGIMPMPDKEIWNMASSIKLPEYLSKGMLIVGVNHPGNSCGDAECFQLSDEDWVKDCIGKISEIENRGCWEKISAESLNMAKKMTWEETAMKIINEIRE